MKNLLRTLPFGLILGDSEHVSNPPAPFPHLGFAIGWGLATQPAQKQYVQKNQSYSPDQVTDFKSGGSLICCIRSSKSAFFFFYETFFLSVVSFIDICNLHGSKRRERAIFIPLFSCHPHTKVQAFICSFASKTLASNF